MKSQKSLRLPAPMKTRGMTELSYASVDFLLQIFLVRFLVTGFLVFVGVDAGALVAGSDFFGVILIKSATVFSGMSASQRISLSRTDIFRLCKIVCACLSGTALMPCCINTVSRLLMILAVSGLSAFIAPRKVKLVPVI